MRAYEGEVKVWDSVVRIFHWSLVLLVFAAFATGEDFLKYHVQLGY